MFLILLCLLTVCANVVLKLDSRRLLSCELADRYFVNGCVSRVIEANNGGPESRASLQKFAKRRAIGHAPAKIFTERPDLR